MSVQPPRVEEIVFEEGTTIIGRAPSPYDVTIVFDDSEAGVITASPPQPYGHVVFDESETEVFTAPAPPSPYEGTVDDAPSSDGVTAGPGPAASPYEAAVAPPPPAASLVPDARIPTYGNVLPQQPVPSPAVVATPPPAEAGVGAPAFDPVALARSRRLGFGFDASGFADDLAALLDQPGGLPKAVGALDVLESQQRLDASVAMDDVGAALATRARAQLARARDTSEGEHLALRVVRLMEVGWTSGRENGLIRSVLRDALPHHTALERAPWEDDDALAASLRANGARIQPLEDGGGSTVYDRYSVVMDAMPPGVTPQAFLKQMATDLNSAVDDRTFDRVNEFRRRPTGATPQVGDIYDIDIPVDDGSVVLAQRTSSSFVLQTIETDVLGQTGSHPEYGAREFGFRTLPDGGTEFYTRGVSRPQNSVFGEIGAMVQRQGWTSLVEGIGSRLARDGGRLRPGSLRTVTTAF